MSSCDHFRSHFGSLKLFGNQTSPTPLCHHDISFDSITLRSWVAFVYIWEICNYEAPNLRWMVRTIRQCVKSGCETCEVETTSHDEKAKGPKGKAQIASSQCTLTTEVHSYRYNVEVSFGFLVVYRTWNYWDLQRNRQQNYVKLAAENDTWPCGKHSRKNPGYGVGKLGFGTV